jgi:Fe-S-cluster containining protein
MVTCLDCGGKCCKSIAIQIDTPKSVDDYQDLKWYLYHPGLSVYLDSDKEWLVEIPIRCRHLDKKGKCRIYSRRPPICKDFDTKTCEENKGEVLVKLKTPEDVDRHVRKLKRQGKL